LAAERLRDLVAFRAGFFLAAFVTFFFSRRAGAVLATRATAFFAAGRSRPSPAALPAIAPAIPPTTVPTGPIMLPITAPVTAPAVSLGIGGILMFSWALGSSGINGTPSFKAFSFYVVRCPREVQPWGNKKAVAAVATAFRKYLKYWSRLTAAALSATIATTIAATTTVATASTASTASWRPRFAWTGFVNGERSAFERLAVNFRNCLLRVLVGAHRHKSEAARFAGKFVLHEHDFLNRASLWKKLL
jgi:hypothetical protein